ncbi:Pseudouridine-metabolizing bifunctional protein [Zalerion maritima]|uniref:Pseudouridine-metabolizing bifunctional protein n=1 Tax=Zalerion maritima TaxID=339359 RepID=A0AAD5WYI6_9PEZI|nr:Pseudouridine-metabolizing bifunctional protein [Zalerion maritima]
MNPSRNLFPVSRIFSVLTARPLAHSAKLLLSQHTLCSSHQTCFEPDRQYSQQPSRNKYPALSGVLQISEEIREALATSKPVVALESTIYTHGALGEDLALEKIIRQGGGVPAVIGVLDGVPKVGLTPDELERLVAGPAQKVSRRDLSYLVGLVSQWFPARLAIPIPIFPAVFLSFLRIRVFGTGGLGGVHRGWQESLDISADLTELGRTRVAVVSSGCKGFLDIPRTLEYLETQGVFVSTFSDGRKGDVEFPAFWARGSGIKSPFTLQTERDAAAIIQAQERLGIESGLLIANPIPEEHAIPQDEMQTAIETAVAEAAEMGYAGPRNTPYILKRIRDLTAERSTAANIALVRSNVSRATKIAVELSNLDSNHESPSTATPASSQGATAAKKEQTTSADNQNEEVCTVPLQCTAMVSASDLTDILTYIEAGQPSRNKADILVAGSVAVDLSCDYAGENVAGSTEMILPHLHTSNPATITQSIGGVGYNVALAAHLVSQETRVRLCSLVGDDIAGHTVLSALQSTGMDVSGVRCLSGSYHSSARTAQYVAVNDKQKNMFTAMADMAIFSKHSFPSYWESAVAGARPSWLAVDGNWSEGDIRAWLRAGSRAGAKVAFEPVSTAKSTRLFSKQSGKGITLGLWPRASIDIATPNQMELRAMNAAARKNDYFESSGWFEVLDSFGMSGANERMRMVLGNDLVDSGTPQMASQMLPYIPTMITKLGPKGVLLTMALGPEDPRLRSGEGLKHIVSKCTSGHPNVGGVYMRLFPTVERVPDVVSVNGVGDTFLGVLIAGLAQGGKIEQLIDVAQKAAVFTLRSRQSVSEDLGVLEKDLKIACARS